MSTELMAKETAAPAPIEAAFGDILTAAKAQVEQSRKIVVTDPTDVDGIKQSREYRLALRQIRIAGEKTRKGLKEDILRAGKAIDGMNNILLQVCEPEEARLEAQEKIAERIQADRKAKLRIEREAALIGLGENPAFHGPFEELPADDWTRKIEGLTVAKNAREEAERKAKEAEAARIKAEQEEAARIRAENARLKAEADAREAAMKAEREASELARKQAEEKAAAERAELERVAKEEAARLKAIADAKEAEARKEREAAAAALKAEQERAKAIEEAARKEAARIAQERAKVEAEAQAKAKAEADAKRKAESAPDKDKIEAFAYAIAEMRLPPMATMEGRKLRHEIEEKAVAFAQWIRGKGNEL